MTKDALSTRLVLIKRTDFQKKISKFYFSPFLKNLKPLYLSFKNKLIYPNVMIMKQVPHYTMHKQNKIAKIRTGLPPRKCFFNVISLTPLPQWAKSRFGPYFQNLLPHFHYLLANILFWSRLVFNKQIKINFLIFKAQLQLLSPHINYVARN